MFPRCSRSFPDLCFSPPGGCAPPPAGCVQNFRIRVLLHPPNVFQGTPVFPRFVFLLPAPGVSFRPAVSESVSPSVLHTTPFLYPATCSPNHLFVFRATKNLPDFVFEPSPITAPKVLRHVFQNTPFFSLVCVSKYSAFVLNPQLFDPERCFCLLFQLL